MAKINAYINKSKRGGYTVTAKHCGRFLESVNYTGSHYIDSLREAREVAMQLKNKWEKELAA